MNQGVKRVAAILGIGFIGFLIGVIANLVYYDILPILMENFPQIFTLEWVLWGLIGALMAIFCSLIYVYAS